MTYTRNIINKVKEGLSDYKICYLLVLFLFCIGIVIGVCTIRYMGQNDKKDLMDYFSNYTKNIAQRDVNYKYLFFTILKKNLLIFIPIILLSFTFFGSTIILIIDIVKGFSLGYTFAFLLSTYSGKGLILAIASILPQNLIYIPAILFLSVMGINISANKIGRAHV